MSTLPENMVSSAGHVPISTSGVAAVGPQVKRWTRAEYYRLAELGWFQNERVELIYGSSPESVGAKSLA